MVSEWLVVRLMLNCVLVKGLRGIYILILKDYNLIGLLKVDLFNILYVVMVFNFEKMKLIWC